jgi:chemotaxis response regulator CheB
MHCLPLSESRVIHQMAAQSVVMAETLTNRDSRIVVLEKQVKDQYAGFSEQLKIESEKLQLQKEITAHTESIVTTYQEEKKTLKKQVRRLKWQRAGLAAVAVLVIGVSL